MAAWPGAIRPLEYQLSSSVLRAPFVRQNRLSDALTDALTALTDWLTDALTDALTVGQICLGPEEPRS